MSPLRPPVSEADHRAGSDESVVTLVEYGDYECPACARAEPIVQQVRKRMGPRLAFVFRHFPLSNVHPHAEHAAEAAEAAASQGRFWEMHEAIFARPSALTDTDLVGRAERLGLDADRVEQELAAGIYARRVRRDFESGVRSGVNGTPTFFINGRRHDGPWDLTTLLEALEDAAKESDRASGQAESLGAGEGRGRSARRTSRS
jgi:protein-disulfide isomerase